MFRRLRSFFTPTQEPPQQLLLTFTEEHTGASNGANDPEMRTRSHDTPSRISKQPASIRHDRKKLKVKRRITDLPHEVLLNIITKLDFSQDDFTYMLLASRTFNDLFVTHSTGILKDIAAQQFPIVSLLVPHVAPTVQWLIKVKGLEELTEEFLTACTRRLKRYSAQFKALADPHYRMIAQVGLRVLAAEEAKMEFDSPGADEDPRFLPEYLPGELLLCISFVGAIISQALECVIKGEPYQDRNERFRRVSDSLLCILSWGSMWAFLIGPSLKLEGEMAELVRRASKMWESRFRDDLKNVDMDDVDDEEDAEGFGQEGLRLKVKVEKLVGKHATRQKLDLAIIDALQESRVSEGDIVKLLRKEDWW